MKTVEWRPDTCKCVLQLQLETQDSDNYVAVESVTDMFGTVYDRVLCNRHSHLTDLQNHHQTVLAENQKKNQVYTDILVMNPDVPQRFSIDNKGILTFSVSGYLTHLQIDILSVNYPDIIFT
jgi:hypothetical protein